MNQYITGAAIRQLRENKKMTQLQLGSLLCVSDKTVSKWETGKSYPDISLLQPLADALSVSVAELLSGNTIQNTNISANMLRSRLYICPICGNVIFSVGEMAVSCHGISLSPAEAEAPDEHHDLILEQVEDEYFVHLDHPMTKDHYISFLAAVSPDRIQLVKLYPEGNAQARFKINMVKRIYYYCNREGLYCRKL